MNLPWTRKTRSEYRLTSIFHSFSFTPRFSGEVAARPPRENRFSGFDRAWETAEAVGVAPAAPGTPLKRGVTETAEVISHRSVKDAD